MDTSAVGPFLQGLLLPAGAGVALWLIVGAILKAFPGATSDQRFWFAFGMAWIIPPTAYGLLILLGYEVFTWDGLLLTIGVAFTTSQGIHRGSEQIEKQLGAH